MKQFATAWVTDIVDGGRLRGAQVLVYLWPELDVPVVHHRCWLGGHVMHWTMEWKPEETDKAWAYLEAVKTNHGDVRDQVKSVFANRLKESLP